MVLNTNTIKYLFSTYHFRVIRFTLHFFQWIPSVRSLHLPSKDLLEWIGDLLFYFFDLLLIPDILEILLVWINGNIRCINPSEIALLKEYFKDQIKYEFIKICNSMPSRISRIAEAFVTFNTIHYHESTSKPIFIHELVHIWQYQKFGSVYIFRSLKAQRSIAGYDYGGLEALYHKMLDNFAFSGFNFEQQGEIFEDYCRVKESNEDVNPLAMASYEFFIHQVSGMKQG